MKAHVAGIYGAYYLVLPDEEKTNEAGPFTAKLTGKMRIAENEKICDIKPKHPLAIGDAVKIRKQEKHDSEINAVIVSVEPRQNSFQRATPYRLQILGANLDAIIMIFSIERPSFNTGLLSRLLVEAELTGITPFIVLNKMDLSKKMDRRQKKISLDHLAYLEKLGYRTFCETLSGGLSEELKQALRPGRYLAFGESGVGKSTLLNAYAEDELQSVSEVGVSRKGKHTTTNPSLFRFGHSGAGVVEVIDVPGVREFGLSHRSVADIRRGFREFSQAVNGECRFRDCTHTNEPECVVLQALTEGKISQERYRHYRQILAAVDEKFKPRRGDMRREVNGE